MVTFASKMSDYATKLDEFHFLRDHFELRKVMQKFEFFACWTVITGIVVVTYFDNAMMLPLSPAIQHYSLIYFKASFLTRALAYTSDFMRAREKFSGDLPLWMILHHCGCLLVHFTAVAGLVYIPEHSLSSYSIQFALVSQSTHQTWMKKHSIVLQRGNILLGLVASFSSYSHHKHLDSDGYAIVTFLFGYGVTVLGEVLLWTGAFSQNHLYITTRKEVKVM